MKVFLKLGQLNNYCALCAKGLKMKKISDLTYECAKKLDGKIFRASVLNYISGGGIELHGDDECDVLDVLTMGVDYEMNVVNAYDTHYIVALVSKESVIVMKSGEINET